MQSREDKIAQAKTKLLQYQMKAKISPTEKSPVYAEAANSVFEISTPTFPPPPHSYRSVSPHLNGAPLRVSEENSQQNTHQIFQETEILAAQQYSNDQNDQQVIYLKSLLEANVQLNDNLQARLDHSYGERQQFESQIASLKQMLSNLSHQKEEDPSARQQLEIREMNQQKREAMIAERELEFERRRQLADQQIQIEEEEWSRREKECSRREEYLLNMERELEIRNEMLGRMEDVLKSTHHAEQNSRGSSDLEKRLEILEKGKFQGELCEVIIELSK